MIKGLLEQVHPVFKLISLIVIMLFTLALTMLVGAGVAIPFWGMDTVSEGFQNIQFTEDSLPFLRYFQILQGLGLFVFPALLTAWLISRNPMKYLGATKGCNHRSMLVLMGGIILLIPLINYIGVLNESMNLPDSLESIEAWMRSKEDMAKELTNLFVGTDSISMLFINIVMIAIIPAVGEELIFRGLIQRIFSVWSRNIHVAVWGTAFVFSAMHLQFYGFIPRLLLGALLGYVYAYSGNIWYAIWVHFINNGFAVILYFLAAREIVPREIDTIGIDSGIGVPIFTSLLGGLMFYSYFKEQYLLKA